LNHSPLNPASGDSDNARKHKRPHTELNDENSDEKSDERSSDALNQKIEAKPTSTTIRVLLGGKPTGYNISKILTDIKSHFKIIKSVLTISMVGENKFLIRGISDSNDFKLLSNKGDPKWPRSMFSTTVDRLKILYDDEPTLMLSAKVIGSARDTINEDGEKQLNSDYGVKSVKRVGKKRYDLLFVNIEKRENALALRRLQASGVGIEVEEWKKVVRLDPCWKCWRTGHQAENCDSNVTLCRYCGAENRHESKLCEYKNINAWHFCGICKVKGHYASDKETCPYYIQKYTELCGSLKVQTPSQVLNKMPNATYVDGASNLMMVMKHYINNPSEFTEVCSGFMDKATIQDYKRKSAACKSRQSADANLQELNNYQNAQSAQHRQPQQHHHQTNNQQQRQQQQHSTQHNQQQRQQAQRPNNQHQQQQQQIQPQQQIQQPNNQHQQHQYVNTAQHANYDSHGHNPIQPNQKQLYSNVHTQQAHNHGVTTEPTLHH
jgi:hypothetical protein